MRRWFFLAAFALSLLPFIRRPWLFDDPSVIVTARAAAAHPWRPYDYSMDLGSPDRAVWLPGQGPAYTHPPLSAWVLGGVLRLAGETEPALHLTVWLFALAALWFAKKIALALEVDDEILGYLAAFSPVMFLSSLTLYPHLFYLAFYLLSIWLALRVAQGASGVWLAALGLSLTLASLSLDHWPVLVLLVVWVTRKRAFLPLAVFACLAGAWGLWEIRAYGASHFWANYHLRVSSRYPWNAAFLPAVFMAGGLPFIGVGWPFLARRSRAAVMGILFLALGTWGLFSGPRGGFTLLQGGLLSLELATGAAFLASILFLWKECPAKTDRFAIGWFLTEFLFVQRFLVYPSGHHLLMLVLPAALLSLGMARKLQWSAARKSFGCLAMAVLTLALAGADQEEAAIGPALARDVSGLVGRRFYWGNDFSGFCYYLKAAGWKAYDPRAPLKTGEFLLVPRNFNVQGAPAFLAALPLRTTAVHIYRIKIPLRTFSLGESAGWYSSSWGALPYSISRSPVEAFFIYSRPSN